MGPFRRTEESSMGLPQMRVRVKRFAGNAVLALTSFASSLLALEAGLRIHSAIPLLDPTNFVVRSLDIVRANSGVMVFDDLLGWRLKDGVGDPGSGFTTSEQGIRTNGSAREPALPKGSVLAVGDSFTAGSGVRDEHTWPAQLEGLLGRPVINAAAGAWGVDQMVLRSEQLARIVSPSVVIVGILAQDSLRNSFDVYGGGFKPWFEVVDGTPVLKGVPVPRFEQQPIQLGWSREILGHSWFVHWAMLRLGFLDRWVTNDNRYRRVMSDEDGVKVSCALMQRLRSKHQGDVIVVLLWGADEARQPQPPWYGPPVIECAREAGIAALDLHSPLHEISQTDRSRFESLWIDEGGVLGHPSAAGQTLIARLLHERFFAVETAGTASAQSEGE
jgi:hypothetical protein